MMKNSSFQGISGQLFHVKTENNIDLVGFLSPSQSETSKIFIVSHGRGGSFYSGYNSFLPHLVKAAHNCGYDFLGISDRGSGFFRIYDIFEDCVADYNSWIKFVESLGYKKVILGAHSYGPIKITYYYDQMKPSIIAGLFYLAPTDTYGMWKNFVGKNENKFLDLAHKMVKTGLGKNLMPNEAYYNPISAQSYLSLYGRNTKIHIFDFQNLDFDYSILRSIDIPILTVLGGEDKNSRDATSEQKAKILSSVLRKPTIKIVEGADHVFLGSGDELKNSLESWLKNI